jgi:hypothetical protein
LLVLVGFLLLRGRDASREVSVGPAPRPLARAQDP